MKKVTPLKCIKAKCQECRGTKLTVKIEACPEKECPLYPYRMGKDPHRKPVTLSPEHRAAANAALERVREERKANKKQDA